MIFLSVTGSFATALTYDRRKKKAVQKKVVRPGSSRRSRESTRQPDA